MECSASAAIEVISISRIIRRRSSSISVRRLAIRCFVSIRILCNFQVDLFCSEGRCLPISLWQPAQISFLLRVGFSRDCLFKCDGLL